MTTTREQAQALDRADPLGEFVECFLVADPDLIYLDGNSLGRLPFATRDRLTGMISEEWGGELVRGWERWIDMPRRVGDLLGKHLLGARRGQVVVSDTTSINLYKLATAALDARPDRHTIVTDTANFPTDRYVLEGVAAARGLRLRLVDTDPVNGIGLDSVRRVLDDDTALVSLSTVDYRSGALVDVAAVTALVHEAGGLVLWDLCHAVGAVPIHLDADGVDLAVGCTYKYVNAGPGAPAFLYVRDELQPSLRQPIWGWFGQQDQFAMGPSYDPVPDIGRFLVSSPGVLGMAAVQEGVCLLAEAGIDAVRAKGVALTELVVELADSWLAAHGFTLASPREASRRGDHVALAHPDAYRIARALIAEAKVLPDFRAPDRLRLGPAPIYTRFVDVWDAMDRLRRLVESGVHVEYPVTPGRVT